MNKTSQDIEREVESARDDLDRTVDALKEKMSPGQLIDEISRSFKGGGAGEMMDNLGAQVRDNPMALAMIGAGMAWLMMGKSGPKTTAVAASAYQGAPAAEDVSGAASGDLVHAVGEVKQMAAHVASDAKAALGGAVDSAMAGAQGLGEQASLAGRSAARTFEEVLQQEPLIIGALGLAVGVAVGAALPSTRLEDRTFGAARDDLVEAGGRKLAAAAEDLGASGQAALEAAREEADRQGLAPSDGSLVDKAEAVVRSAATAARDELGQGRPS
jgi:Protein of unknown function (DUF3618)